MKTHFKAASIMAACILSVSVINAQPPAPGKGRMPGGPGAPPPPQAQQLQEVTKLSGKVVKMTTNDDYVYDGFCILNGSDSMFVKFPPHLGSQITKAASVGNNVTVNGVANVSPSGQKEIRMVSITAGGQTITDTPPSMPVTPVAETSLSGSGKVSNMQTNREGRVSGLMLNNNIILKIPPHVADQLSGMLQTGASVSYTGNKKTVRNGEVSSGNYTIIHCITITVNGKEYLVR